MYNDQSFDEVIGEENMLFEYDRTYNFEDNEAQPSVTPTNPTLTTQPKIEAIIQKQIENTLPLPEKKQSRIIYRLAAWIIEAMMPLDCINHDRFRDFCYEINQRFEVPCTNTIKNVIKESVIYTHASLKEMLDQTMISVSITTDLWTQNHVPYIGITAHWLSKDFIIAVITDNASSMVKAVRQLGTTHLGCTAHTIHLAVTDGLKECEVLIGRAKFLNNFLVNRDKYRSLFRKIQHDIIEKNKITNPLTTNTHILEPISKLATKLKNNSDRAIRADGLEELCQILRHFAHALTFVGGDQYPILSMMYPTVRHLFKNLDQIEDKLTHPDIIEMHKGLRSSMISRWDDPEMVGWLATFLDPRFKTLSAASPTIQQDVFQEIHKRIKLSHQTNDLPSINQAPTTEMSSFFDDGNELSSLSPIDTELQIYLSILQIPKYDPKDLRYDK
ncbi:6214_t:CDS:2, partial [Cetraspora pellucida]